MNARKWEPLTDFSRIDRRYDLIVTKKNVDLSHQRHKIRNCHWNLFLHFPSYISHFLVTNTIMAHEIEFFRSYLISDLYLIYVLNDFKNSNVCCFCYNSFLHKETETFYSLFVWLTIMMQVTIHQIANQRWTLIWIWRVILISRFGSVQCHAIYMNNHIFFPQFNRHVLHSR